MVACDALWQTGLSRAELQEIAAGLGSDVPFSLVGGTALGTGRGQILTPVLARGRFEWVVAVAEDGLSTPDRSSCRCRIFVVASSSSKYICEKYRWMKTCSRA
jgi:4-diphosphocytidyl-2C-methyl-D-erythritol kinase